MSTRASSLRAALVLGLAALPVMAQPRAAVPSPRLVEAPDRVLDRGDVAIRYRVIGEGAPLLLIHGFTDRLEMWAGTADSLARRYRVIVPDVRGFGRSVPRGTAPRYGAAMVDDARALLDALGIGRAHVVGYSMGGLIAANLALAHPDRVASVAFIAAAVVEEDAATAARVIAPYIAAIPTEAGLYPFFKWIVPTWPDSIVRGAAQQLLAEHDRAALVGVAASLADLSPDWQRVRGSCVPAVAVVGTLDPLEPYSARLAARWPRTALIHVPGADHIDITNVAPTMAAIDSVVAAAMRESEADGARARCDRMRPRR